MDEEDLLRKLGMSEEKETWGGDSGMELESDLMKAPIVPWAYPGEPLKRVPSYARPAEFAAPP